jgi:hypothetical protein
LAKLSTGSADAEDNPREGTVKATVPAKVSKRKARDDRLNDFEALARFANLGDKPDDWANFRRICLGMCPKFFPADMTEWIYINAEEWWNLSNLPDTRPGDYQSLLRRWPTVNKAAITFKNWPNFARNWRRRMRNVRPPLLFYRNLLRRVWRRKDPYGNSLSVLLGFDAAMAPILEEGEIEKEDPSIIEVGGTIIELEAPVDYGQLFMWKAPETEMPQVDTDNGIITWKQRETNCGLPIGTPTVDVDTSTIVWKFDCQFQSGIYYLMQERWRARVCPQCRKYFVADKVARRYCSTDCYEERKRKESLDRYHRIEKERRQSRATQTRFRKRKS